MKAWIGTFALTALTVAIGGCDSGPADSERAIALAKADVATEFKDPGSVNFRNMQIENNASADGSIYVCGEVNAKNGFGAYVGYEKFYSRVEGQGSSVKVKYSVLKGPAIERGTWFYPLGCKL